MLRISNSHHPLDVCERYDLEVLPSFGLPLFRADFLTFASTFVQI
jgi:hypothetical protein